MGQVVVGIVAEEEAAVVQMVEMRDLALEVEVALALVAEVVVSEEEEQELLLLL